MCIAFPVHPQAARDAAQKTKKAWLEFLREMPSHDTLPAVAVFGAPSSKDGVSLLVATPSRRASVLHLAAHETRNRVIRD